MLSVFANCDLCSGFIDSISVSPENYDFEISNTLIDKIRNKGAIISCFNSRYTKFVCIECLDKIIKEQFDHKGDGA